MHYPLLNTCLNWFKIVKSHFQGALCTLQTSNKGLMIIMSLTCNAQELAIVFLLGLLEIFKILFLIF
jgi:hypothetical protein